MNKLLAVFALSLALASCDMRDRSQRLADEAKALKQLPSSGGLGSFSVYVVDSCEYIGMAVGQRHSMFTHKGNCGYCKARRKKD